MHLKRLEIVGFKSFADAFEMEFQMGISCIVGPNGCGKSNIADAIRWALGSQSPNELRADRMEDVIFSGAMDRKAQGMAEVILTFDNSNRDLDLDFDEVTVTRRLFRSGDSEYLLNGNRCRLMDIADLIVDKGLGSNGYWILEKNMTKTIIESSPSDRRFLFDEAAGIVKYKMQRHRAELKLSSVADDLERLDDIISEVENNVAALKKQVSAFRRWERAEKKITELRSLKQYRVLSGLEGELSNLKKEMKTCESRRQKAEAAHSAASAKQGQARVELDRAQSELDSRHEKCASLDSTIGSRKGELAVAEERFRNLRLRIEDLQRERTAAEGRITRFTGEAESLKQKQQELKERIEKARAELEEASRGTASTEELHTKKTRELERAREEHDKLSRGLQKMRKEYTDGLRARERASGDLKSAEERKEHLGSAAEDVEENLRSIELQLRENKKLRDRLDSRRNDLLESDSSLASDIETLSSRLHSLEMDQGLVKARIENLREASSETVPAHTLSSVLPVREGMGMAVGAWLDSFQEAGVLAEGEDLPRVSGGKRFFLPAEDAEKPAVPEGGVWLPECLEPEAGESYRSLLAGAVLAPDRASALEWFIQGIDLDIVTPQGDLFRSGGLVRLGVPESGGGAMEREALAVQAEDRLKEIDGKMRDLKTDEQALQKKRDGIKSDLQRLSEEISGAGKMEASLSATEEGYRSRLREIQDQSAELAERIPQLRQALKEQDPGKTSEGMNRLTGELEKFSASLKKLETEKEELGAGLNSLIREENQLRLSFTSLETELEQTETSRRRFLEDAEESGKRIQEINGEMKQLKKDSGELKDNIGKLEKKLEELSESRKQAEESRTAASRKRAQWLEKSRNADAELMRKRELLSQVREEIVSLMGQKETLERRCEELRSAELKLPEENSRYWKLTEEKLQKELDRQIGYRENLGPVNMLAVTEYEEGKKRIEFLQEQRSDLDQARESLLGAISEINRTAAEKFDETFLEVRKHFKEMFTSLFAGGEADIIAMDSEDPLEGGVQIMARPPGKKLENITALSSGERAMTAAALLFALYLVKPSPFCVLDELDAPLDDANVDNYVNLLKGFVDRTQFIVITHNKRTMEAADRLFGITMAEKGVSVMTTVSLEKTRRISGE